MRAIFRRENWWSITKESFNPHAFPANVGRKYITAPQLELMKANAIFTLILLVNDDLVGTIAIHTDPALAWVALKASY